MSAPDLITTGGRNWSSTLLSLPAEIRAIILRYLFLVRSNRSQRCRMSTLCDADYDELCNEVSVGSPENIDPVRGIKHADHPMRSHESVSYQLQPVILRTCKQMHAEGKEILYKENIFLAIAWTGCSRLNTTTETLDLFAGVGIMTEWKMSTENFDGLFGKMPETHQPAAKIDYVDRTATDIRLVCLDDINLAVRAMYIAFSPEKPGTRSRRRTAELQCLRPDGFLKIVIARTAGAEAVFDSLLLPWIGNRIIDLRVMGHSMLQDSFFASSKVQSYAQRCKDARIATPHHRALMQVTYLQQCLQTIEAKMQGGASLATTAQALLALISTALDPFRHPLRRSLPKTLAKTPLNRIIAIAAWHFSHLHLPSHIKFPDNVSTNLSFDLKRHQILLALCAANLPSPSLLIADEDWKVHTNLQTARLAEEINPERASLRLGWAVRHSATAAERLLWLDDRVARGKWFGDQVQGAWKAKYGEKGDKGLRRLMVEVDIDDKPSFTDLELVLDAWVGWKGLQKGLVVSVAEKTVDDRMCENMVQNTELRFVWQED